MCMNTIRIKDETKRRHNLINNNNNDDKLELNSAKLSKEVGR